MILKRANTMNSPNEAHRDPKQEKISDIQKKIDNIPGTSCLRLLSLKPKEHTASRASNWERTSSKSNSPRPVVDVHLP